MAGSLMVMDQRLWDRDLVLDLFKERDAALILYFPKGLQPLRIIGFRNWRGQVAILSKALTG